MADVAKRPMSFTNQIRQAVKDSAVTRYRIAQETGIAQSTLSRFVTGKAGLSWGALDKLAAFIGIEVARRK